MQFIGKCSKIFCFLIAILLVSMSNVQSQDIFREMSQVKSDLSTLKNEVNDLKRLVLELRRVILEQVIVPAGQAPGTVRVGDQAKKGKKPSPKDEEQITKIACKSVGQFFVEAEAALRSSDPSIARSRMHNAMQKLTLALQDYSRTHRVTKLLRIYDGLAWDTYTAVQLRQSITGNEDFLAQLRKHKKKFIETCPKE